MMEYSELQNKVLNEAKRRLKHKKWYRGICVDNVPKDGDIKLNGFEWAVHEIIYETEFWDAPNMGF